VSIAFLNGRFDALERLAVSPLDRGFLFADGVYEVIPCYGGQLFRVDAHLARLERSLAAVAIGNPHSREQWRRLLEELVERNGGGDRLLYVQITRGVAEREHAFPREAVPTVFAMARAHARPEKPAPARAVILEDNRWRRCDIKSVALLANVLLREQAVARGAHEAILMRDGCVTEGAASNVFAVRGDALLTPPRSPYILGGITRDVILELAPEAGLAPFETTLTREMLRTADEIWLTSSSMEVRPVVALDGEPVSGGVAGPASTRMHALFARATESARANEAG